MCPRGDCTQNPMLADVRVRPGRPWRCAVTATEHVIRWSTAGAVVGAAVAAVTSYEHAYAPGAGAREAGWTGRLVPLTVDGLIYASSMVMLDSARRKMPVPALARWLLGLGIAATLAANVAHGLGHGPVGAAVAAWPAVALVGSYELLMMVIRSSQAAADSATARSALSCMWVSLGGSGCGTTWLHGLQGGRTVSLREQLGGGWRPWPERATAAREYPPEAQETKHE
jgi:hypothetical protein